MEYTASKTIAEFMQSNARIRALVGPLGSGKSMGALMELFRRSVEQEPDKNGTRPTRMALVRNTAAQLRETLLKDAAQYFGAFFDYKVSTSTLEFRFKMADGTRIESDWLAVPLDRPEDQKKLLSLNLTGALVDECREVPYQIIAALDGRIGRFPPPIRVKRTWRGLILVSNPWSVASEYHEHFVLNPPAGWELFKQPGGLDQDAENLQYLDPDYYARLTEGRSEEWVKVHVHGQWGDDLSGKAVYQHSWDAEVHSASTIEPNPVLPLLVGMDFGRNPAAVITQDDIYGRLLVLDEFVREDMGLERFLEDFVPYVRDTYPTYRIFVVGDPAGAARSGYNEDSAFAVLERRGFSAIPAPTNDLHRRLQAVERRLIQRTSRGGGLLLSRSQCPVLFEGFERGYKYRRLKTGDIAPLPDKNRFSHPHDALQYAALGHQSHFVARRLKSSGSSVRRRPAPSPAAWT